MPDDLRLIVAVCLTVILVLIIVLAPFWLHAFSKSRDDGPDELPDSDSYLEAMCRHATGELAPVHDEGVSE